MCAGEYLYAFDPTALLLVCNEVQKEGGKHFCEFCHLKPGYTHFIHAHTEIALSRCEKDPNCCQMTRYLWRVEASGMTSLRFIAFKFISVKCDLWERREVTILG